MGPRRVVVTLELSTDLGLRYLRDKRWWWPKLNTGIVVTNVLQAQANVIRSQKVSAKKRM